MKEQLLHTYILKNLQKEFYTYPEAYFRLRVSLT